VVLLTVLLAVAAAVLGAAFVLPAALLPTFVLALLAPVATFAGWAAAAAPAAAARGAAFAGSAAGVARDERFTVAAGNALEAAEVVEVDEEAGAAAGALDAAPARAAGFFACVRIAVAPSKSLPWPLVAGADNFSVDVLLMNSPLFILI
jgi:hypothetical protein